MSNSNVGGEFYSIREIRSRVRREITALEDVQYKLRHNHFNVGTDICADKLDTVLSQLRATDAALRKMNK